MRSATKLFAGIAVLTVAVVFGGVTSSSASAGPVHGTAEQRTAKQTRAFLAALERKDAQAVDAVIAQRATLTIPLSFSGDQVPAGHFAGKEQVLGYLGGVFTNMATIDFVDVRVSVTAGGRTSFAQANGQFVTADGRPYRNTYIFRFDWDGGLIVGSEEYGNPVTYCRTFGHPDC